VLASRGANIVAVELDRDLVPFLRVQFEHTPLVTIVEADILNTTPEQLLVAASVAAPYAVVANLPYNIAAPTLRMFLESHCQPTRLVVMVQAEVAESMASAPGKMSLLAVATQVYADTRIVMRVAPGAFTPPPKVHSAVVRLDVLPRPRVSVPLDAFFRVVRAGFGNPRKQLRNSLSFGLHVKQERVDAVLAAGGIDPTRRPHMLSIAEWESIASAWLERPDQ
jgi:16S rRNA (adenine1518-N6/adenine1519-N6)-dimethyltransferase